MAFGPRVEAAVAAIVGAKREPAEVFGAVRAMRDLIASEKGDDDPWDLKLARGGLTDLDFIAQALVLAHASATPGPDRPADGGDLRGGPGGGPPRRGRRPAARRGAPALQRRSSNGSG